MWLTLYVSYDGAAPELISDSLTSSGNIAMGKK